MKIKVLSSKEYFEQDKNYGDCILIDTGLNLIIYDCGSEEHAKRVEQYMHEHGYETVAVILSHNDGDHFGGLEYLIKNNMVSSITTTLLLKHIDDILTMLDDGRRNRDSIKTEIKKTFDNVAKLSGQKLNDALDRNVNLDPCVNLVGPNYDYVINAVVKELDSSESNNIDMETIKNAISVQVEIIIGNSKILLTGDASFPAIEDKIREYDIIQLPHHGKYDQAEKIFEKNQGRNNVKYLISDNTGTSNGGSDELMENDIGHILMNTKNEDISIDLNAIKKESKGCYGLWDTLY